VPQTQQNERRALQAAEKLRMGGEMAKIGGWKTISQPSRIVPGASWRDPFFALFEKSSFSAACLAPEGKPKVYTISESALILQL
jgi:hypothetical protein